MEQKLIPRKGRERASSMNFDDEEGMRIDRKGFSFRTSPPFLGTNDRNSSHDIIFYCLCYLFFHGIGLKIFSRIIIELIEGILISDLSRCLELFTSSKG